jgi:hypothetical protein
MDQISQTLCRTAYRYTKLFLYTRQWIIAEGFLSNKEPNFSNVLFAKSSAYSQFNLITDNTEKKKQNINSKKLFQSSISHENDDGWRHRDYCWEISLPTCVQRFIGLLSCHNPKQYCHNRIILLTYFPNFEKKIKLMRSPWCQCVCESPPTPSNFECLNQSIWNLVHISWHPNQCQRRASWIIPTNLCVCMCISVLLLGNGSVKTLSWQRIHTQQ